RPSSRPCLKPSLRPRSISSSPMVFACLRPILRPRSISFSPMVLAMIWNSSRTIFAIVHHGRLPHVAAGHERWARRSSRITAGCLRRSGSGGPTSIRQGLRQRARREHAIGDARERRSGGARESVLRRHRQLAEALPDDSLSLHDALPILAFLATLLEAKLAAS